MAPALPVDVCGAEYDELQVATLLEIHHLKTKTKTLQRFGEFSVKLCHPKSTGDIACGNRLSVPF